MYHGMAALLTRSLRIEARQIVPHVMRLAFVLMLYFSFFFAQIGSLYSSAPGKQFFTSMIYLNAGFIILAGVSFFSTAITEEKEEATLGLMRMAGISPLAVLLGKSTSRLITSLLLLVIQLPFTLLAITLGGVTFDQVAASYVALMAFVVALANVALFCSVVANKAGTAGALTVFFVVLYCIVPPYCQYLLTIYGNWAAIDVGGWPKTVVEWAAASSVFERLGVIMTTGFGDPTQGLLVTDESIGWWSRQWSRLSLYVTAQVVTNVLTGLAFFLLSWAVFDRITRYEQRAPRLPGLSALSGKASRYTFVDRAWSNALVWRDFHFICGGWRVVAYRQLGWWSIVLLVLGIWIANDTMGTISPEDVGHLAIAVFMVAIVVEPALFASRTFRDEVQSQTLSALMMLPHSLPYLCYSKVAGCVLAALPTYVSLFLALLMGGELGEAAETMSEPMAWVPVLYVVVFYHLIATLSLFVKWGALPLSIFVMLIGSWCSSAFMIVLFSGMGMSQVESRWVMLVLFLFITGIILLVFHAVIASRLQVLASK